MPVTDESGTTEQTSPVNRSPHHSAPANRLRQVAAVSGAVVCLALAAVGFFLPVLPCTPFVLLASGLLIRGSPALHKKLRASRFFGRILRDWEDRKGIRRADKVRAIVVVILGLMFTIFVVQPATPFIILTVFFVIIGLWVIVRLPIAKTPES